MGTTNTAETPEVSTEEEAVIVEPNESENAAEASEVSEEGEEQQEPAEIEVVRSGANGSQPDKQHEINRIVKKRVNKLNKQKAEAQDETAQTADALAVSEQKVKLLTLALEQKAPAETPTPPDPNDFDDGVRDPKYVKALNDFNQPLIAAEVHRQTANLAPVQTETTDPNLERKQTKHYERADKLGAKDFDETEGAAIAILGNNTVNHLIRSSDKSELILYYLGKNPGQAEEIAELVKADPVTAMLRIGRLEAELSTKPRANSEPAPDPDEELEGGTPSASKTNKHQRTVDAAREKARETGDMKPVLDAKKAARDAGVTVN